MNIDTASAFSIVSKVHLNSIAFFLALSFLIDETELFRFGRAIENTIDNNCVIQKLVPNYFGQVRMLWVRRMAVTHHFVMEKYTN